MMALWLFGCTPRVDEWSCISSHCGRVLSHDPEGLMRIQRWACLIDGTQHHLPWVLSTEACPAESTESPGSTWYQHHPWYFSLPIYWGRVSQSQFTDSSSLAIHFVLGLSCLCLLSFETGRESCHTVFYPPGSCALSMVNIDRATPRWLLTQVHYLHPQQDCSYSVLISITVEI